MFFQFAAMVVICASLQVIGPCGNAQVDPFFEQENGFYLCE
jgi:hypothetical protein